MLIKRRTEETIYPASPSPHTLLHLSNNDQIMPRMYTSMLFFFKQSSQALHAGQLLRSSLQQLLTSFYPCAGRYKERENGGLDVDCSDQGVAFCEVWIEASLDSFGDFQPRSDFGLLVPPGNPTALISEIPLLVVQITNFDCGGLCLGIQLHHTLCDGVSLSHLMKSWAEIASGNGLTLHPHLDRSPLKARQPPSPTFHHPELQTAMPELLSRWPAMKSPAMPQLPSSWPAMTSWIFRFSPETIELLKGKARKEGDATASSSRSGFESVAAHLWKCVTRVRGLNPTEEVRLGMMVDGRKRFNPVLEEGYFGNVNFCGYAIAQAGELEEKPLWYAADLVHDAIARVTNEQMRSAMDWVEKQASPTSIFPSFFRPFKDLAITSWSKFPLYNLDFGWGTPCFVGTPTPLSEGLIVFLPTTKGQAHIDALIGLRVEQMHNFQAGLIAF